MQSCLISLSFNFRCLCYEFHNQLLPSVFDAFFNPVRNIHSYNTRLSCRMTYAIPKSRANYGILNIRFQGDKVWNDISDDIKLLSNVLSFCGSVTALNVRSPATWAASFTLVLTLHKLATKNLHLVTILEDLIFFGSV